MTYKNTIISILLTLAAGATILFTLAYQSDNDHKKADPHIPDAYMENVTAIFLDKFGKMTMKIETPKMVHFAENDTTKFLFPQLTVFHKSPNPWYIASKTAKAWDGIENVIFKNDVTIHHPADYKNPATIIKTNTLHVHPNQKTAETADPITMIQPNSIMKAVGMQADMETGDIKLLSHAEGEYVPDA
ncbi:MAG TPA: LPS export ABC transporter periplasmic protein LptC [Gammaproteobacteria bacterium]|jgi:LPS export ABC transporter protein LptC|nr:LPS export ABC transporter periplasmic protein LptC [Gammaproteobacteria bacterium]